MMRRTTKLDNLYFTWLCEKTREPDYENYSALLRFLFNTPFTYIHPMDENRWRDGISLRKRYYSEERIPIQTLEEKPCSVLEMMIALAIRCEEITDNSPGNHNAASIFWGMISNCGLWTLPDSYFNSQKAGEIIQRVLNREYAWNGEGGFFTLNYPREDLRKTELWYQAMWYLAEILT